MEEPRQNFLPIKILHDFAEKIERLKIPYMLSGSMAMMNYSVYRFTADIDIVLELKSSDASRIITAFEPEYYVPHNAVSRAIASERMFNLIHQETAFKVDCVIRKSTEFQKNAFSRRRKIDFYGEYIWIITHEDLILSKLWWAKESFSEKQLTDIKNLLRTTDEEFYDLEYIKKWAIKLDVENTLNECLEAIKQ